VVAPVLVGVGLGEVGYSVVERVRAAEVGRDRDPVANGAFVRAAFPTAARCSGVEGLADADALLPAAADRLVVRATGDTLRHASAPTRVQSRAPLSRVGHGTTLPGLDDGRDG
jgi:hypothetical protein